MSFICPTRPTFLVRPARRPALHQALWLMGKLGQYLKADLTSSVTISLDPWFLQLFLTGPVFQILPLSHHAVVFTNS